MCCLNVWPSASLQLYIVAHCDKQLHAPGLDQGLPNWGARTHNGTYAYLKGCI